MKWIEPTTLLRFRVRIFGCINVRQVLNGLKSVFYQRLSNTMVKLSMRLEEFLPKTRSSFKKRTTFREQLNFKKV